MFPSSVCWTFSLVVQNFCTFWMFSYNKLKDFFPFFCLFLQGFVSTTFTLIILYYDIKFNKTVL